jgi:hypothetical protein
MVCVREPFDQVCPLTALENRFRYLAGQAGYEKGFIQHYIAPVVYPGVMPERWGLIASFSVLFWNVLVYTLLMVTLRRIGPLRAATKQAYRDSRRVREGRLRPATGVAPTGSERPWRRRIFSG